MKRISNKKRKLNYIREKNYYRLGGIGVDYFKMSKEMFSDIDFTEKQIIRSIDDSLKRMSKKYKLTFGSNPLWIESGLDGNDFLRELTTIKFKFKAVL